MHGPRGRHRLRHWWLLLIQVLVPGKAFLNDIERPLIVSRAGSLGLQSKLALLRMQITLKVQPWHDCCLEGRRHRIVKAVRLGFSGLTWIVEGRYWFAQVYHRNDGVSPDLWATELALSTERTLSPVVLLLALHHCRVIHSVAVVVTREVLLIRSKG